MIHIEQLDYLAPRRSFRLLIESLQIEADHVTVLLGDNGAGKTTLLRLIAGLLVPRAGRIVVEGRPPAAQRSRLAFVSGEGSGLMNYRPDDYEDLDASLYPDFDRVRFGQLVRFMNLPRRDVGRLSQGERLRLGLARALARQPAVLLLDEPFPVLDLAGRDALLSLLSRFMPDGQHIVIATHQLREAEQYADRVVVLRHGRVERSDEIDVIRGEGERLEAYLRRTLKHESSRVWTFFDKNEG